MYNFNENNQMRYILSKSKTHISHRWTVLVFFYRRAQRGWSIIQKLAKIWCFV